MVSAPFDYVRVDDYDDAIKALVQYGEDAKILAGGQSLVPMLNLRLARPSVLIDINEVDKRAVTVENDILHLPALTRHKVLLGSPVVKKHVPLLSAAATHVGNVRVRARGTLGGSLAHADPTAELATCALALDATIVARGPGGERRIPAAEFFVTYLTTSLEPEEIVTDVYFPVATASQGWSFQEIVRRASDFAMVAVALRIDLAGPGQSISAARMSLAGVADRVVSVEESLLSPLIGSRAEGDLVGELSRAISQSVDPDSDVHASGAYRRRMVAVLAHRAIDEAFERANGQGVTA